MSLSQLVEKVLASLKSDIAATLLAMGGEGAGREIDIENIVRKIANDIILTHWEEPLLTTDSNWKRKCTSRVDAYLKTSDIAERIQKEKKHLPKAHSVEKSKLHYLDELCRRAATTALLIHGGISPKEFYRN